MRIILVFLLFMFQPVDSFSQIRLTNEELKEIEERTLIKVEEFQQYLSDIVNTNFSEHQRKASVESALALFIGKGEAYSITNEYDQRVNQKPVKVYLKDSVNNIRVMTIKRFLSKMYNTPHQYGKMKIQSVDIPQIVSLYENNGAYQAEVQLCNKNVLKNDSIIDLVTTNKRFFIPVSTTELPNGGIVYGTGLGDVHIFVSK